MAFGKIFFRGVCPVALFGIMWACCGTAAEAQQTRSRVPDGRQPESAPQLPWEQIPGEGANPDDEPGMAAGRLIDSLFNPNAPESHVPEIISQALGRSPYQGAARRSSLRGRLVRNPDTDNGSAPFVLVDRYGGIQRYVESVSDIDLEMYEGEIVGVRRDTGDTLLASQLELPRTPGKNRGFQLAGHEEPISAGELIPEPSGETIDQENPLIIPEGIDPVYLDDQFGQGGCPSCGGLALHQTGCGQGIRGGRNKFYVLGEYLYWGVSGMDIPPLVVAGEAEDIDVPPDGELDFVNAAIIYGNQEILTEGRSGARIRLGLWLGGGPWALEGEYLGLGKVSSSFTAGGDDGLFLDMPYIGRPFIDARTGMNAVEDVYFPGITGNVTVNADSELGSGGIWFRRSFCTIAGCQQECCDDITCDSPVGCGTGVGRCGTGKCGRWLSRCGNKFRQGTRRMDFIFGIRTARLRENLGITENLQTTDVPLTTFQVNDQFSTTNDFTGFELGYLMGWQHRRWSLDLQTRLAIGGTRQQVDIHGDTVQNSGTGPVPGDGGLLALSSNIGHYQRDEFSVLPQLGATLGFALTRRLRLTVGYNFFYWSRVVRPGDQIDLEVNPGLLPFADDPSTIPARPWFAFRDTDLWAQGLSLGADYRW